MKSDQKKYFDKAINFLGGLKLSFILLVLLGGLAAQKAIVMQKTIAMENVPWIIKTLNSLGINSPEILSIILIIVLVFFVLNLVLSSIRMARRVKIKQRSLRSYRTTESIMSLPTHDRFQAPSNFQKTITDYFKKKGFRITQENSDTETRFYAGKHESGLWGVLFFHLTFMVLLVGALLSVLTRYAGYAELSTGDIFIEKRENYKRVTERPILFGKDRLFGLRLEEIDLTYWQPWIVKQRANIVSVFDAGGTFLGKQRMEINNPLHIEGRNIYQGTRQGFVASLEVTDSKGTKAEGTARFRFPDKAEGRMISGVTLPGTALDLELELFTERIGEIKGLESLRSTHMATLIKVTSIEAGRRKFRGVVFLGSKISFEDLTLRFTNLRPYSSFVVVKDYGVPVIFASFVFLLSGLLIIFFWVPESYWIAIKTEEGASQIIIGATAERYKESFRERFADFPVTIEVINRSLSSLRPSL